jgi:phosphoglycolate phosphatase-like HAD superfamily hydrolase
VRAIFFDWDGTIVDSMPAIKEAEAELCRNLGIHFDDEVFRRTFSPNWHRLYRELGIPPERDDEVAAVWVANFRPDLVEPFPGVGDAIGKLADAGCTIGLVTGGDRAGIEPQLRRTGLGDLVTVRVYADDTTAGKPDPGPLRLALERAGLAGGDGACYVGDALDDMRMAAAAGVHGVGIVSMVASAEDLLAAGAAETAGSVVAWSERFLAETGRAR